MVLASSALTRQRMDGVYVILDPDDTAQALVLNTTAVTSPGNADVTPNALGMGQAAWDTCHTCDSPQGICTALSPTDRAYDPYDQLDLYRASTLKAVVRSEYDVTCAGTIPELTDVTPLRFPVIALDCDPPSNLTLRLSIGLNTSALTWTSGAPDLKLSKATQITPANGASTGQVEVELRNDGGARGMYDVTPATCRGLDAAEQ